MRLPMKRSLTAAWLLLSLQACGQQAGDGGKAPTGVPKAQPTPVLKVSPVEPPPTPPERYAARCRALDPLPVGDDVLSPRKREAPPVPERILRQKTFGQIVLDAILDAEGNVCDVVPVKSLGPSVDAELTAWARKLKYDPATRGGKPVACFFRIRIVLDL